MDNYIRTLADNQKLQHGCPWDNHFYFVNSDTGSVLCSPIQTVQIDLKVVLMAGGFRGCCRHAYYTSPFCN